MPHTLLERSSFLEDYTALALGINAVNPAAADRFCDEVEHALKLLAQFPELGPSARFERAVGVRKWRIRRFRRYLIFYRVRADTVELIRLLHGARNLPPSWKMNRLSEDQLVSTPTMQRRSFLKTSIVAASVTGLASPLAARAADPKPKVNLEYYELRTYTLKAAKQPLLDGYLSQAFIPAVKRFGSGPVGVFVEKLETGEVKVYVLIVHPSAEQFATLSARLAAEAEHRKAGAEYLAAVAADPVYARIESSLLAAIEGMPRLARPDASKPRLLNLRIYESHNERAAKKKIEMFNTGELAIFRRVGLTPVLFGETILGAKMPNLTYLLVFPDEAGRKKAWDTFRADPAWLKLKAIPEFADKEIVSAITNKILAPAAYSEI